MSIKKIRKLLKEDDLKDLEKELDLKKEESDKDEEEKEVEEASDELDLDKEVEKEAKDEDEVPAEEDEVAEEEKEKAPEGDEEEVEEAEKDAYADEEGIEPEESDAEKEFDLNDESDVFLDDEEEGEAKKEEAEEDEKEVEEAAKKDEDEEEVEEGCDKEEEKKEVEEAKKPKIDVEEHVKALFNGESLSEEFQNKARTIFQAAVKEKVLQYAKNLKGRYNKKLGVAKQSIQEKLVNKLDGYMDYVVEEWMEENKVAVEHGLRTEITEEFVTDLRNLFETHNIMIPKGKENLVEALVAKCDKLEKELDSSEKKNISLRKKLNENKKVEVFREICEGLADTEIEKLRSLSSTLEFDDSYKSKLSVIKENYFSTKTKKADPIEKIDEDKKESEKVAAPATSKMQRYIDISKKLR